MLQTSKQETILKGSRRLPVSSRFNRRPRSVRRQVPSEWPFSLEADDSGARPPCVRPTIAHNSDGLAAQLKRISRAILALSPLFSPCLWPRRGAMPSGQAARMIGSMGSEIVAHAVFFCANCHCPVLPGWPARRKDRAPSSKSVKVPPPRKRSHSLRPGL